MNELVVGFDGSQQSHWALRWAASVAAHNGVGLVIARARTGGDPRDGDESDGRVREEVAREAGEVLGDGSAGIEIRVEAWRGPTVESLLERVTPDDALVLGSRGRGGFAGLLLGSVSRECVEHAACPVIILRDEEAAPTSGSPLIVGHDGSANSARAVQWAEELAAPVGAEVVAAHIWQTAASEVRPTSHDRNRAAAAASVETWVGESGSAARPMELEGEPRMELVKLAERVHAGLIVIGRRGAGTVKALRMGSVASYLVTSSPTPVAIIPPGPESSDS